MTRIAVIGAAGHHGKVLVEAKLWLLVTAVLGAAVVCPDSSLGGG